MYGRGASSLTHTFFSIYAKTVEVYSNLGNNISLGFTQHLVVHFCLQFATPDYAPYQSVRAADAADVVYGRAVEEYSSCNEVQLEYRSS